MMVYLSRARAHKLDSSPLNFPVHGRQPAIVWLASHRYNLNVENDAIFLMQACLWSALRLPLEHIEGR